MAGVSAINAKHHKRKTLQISDILTAANTFDRFYFIKDSKLPFIQPVGQKPKDAGEDKEMVEAADEDAEMEDQQ